MSIRNGWEPCHFVRLNTKIPSGINNGTIIAAENNVNGISPWDEGNMAYAHVDSRRSHQQFSFILFCFWKTGSTTTVFFSVAKYCQHIKLPTESFVLSCSFVFWSFPLLLSVPCYVSERKKTQLILVGKLVWAISQCFGPLIYSSLFLYASWNK